MDLESASNSSSASSGEPRERAENLIVVEKRNSRGESDLRTALRELEVHRIELKMQREELCRTRLQYEELVTDYSEVQANLEASARHFCALADAMPQLVFIADPGGEVRHFNRQIYKYTVGPLPAPKDLWQTIVFPDELLEFNRAWVTAGACGERFEIEVRLADGKGSYRWHIVRALAEEGATQWFGTATDIHDQKQTRQALEAADACKENFMAMLAHELRNPLSAIRSALCLSKNPKTSQDKRSWAIEMANRQVTHLSKLIDDLLDVSRINHGKIRLDQSIVSLDKVVAEVVESLGETFSERQQVLEIRRLDPDLFVSGDRARLHQVLVNLLVNASKYSADGAHVTVSAHHDHGAVVVTVVDNGRGMEPSVIRHIFEPFYQSPCSLARSRGGLGIGLALVKKLVALQSGQVTAHSAGVGKGSTFTVTFPLALNAEVVTRPEQERIDKPMSRRILVVEDNDDGREALRMLLEATGQIVATAADGPSGLTAFNSFRPDIALLDVGLPGMTGYELASIIRKSENSSCTLIALTGYGQPGDKERSREAGFDHHLVKPVEIDQLLSICGDAAQIQTTVEGSTNPVENS